MPDVIDVLEQDHRLVERLFQQYGQSNDPDVARRICEALMLHAEAEEQLVYPVLGGEVPDGEPLAEEAAEQHGQVEELIERVRSSDFDGGDVPALMQEVQVAVEHHVEEEESEIFPKMRASIDPGRLDEMGEQVQELKREEAAAGAPRAGSSGGGHASRSRDGNSGTRNGATRSGGKNGRSAGGGEPTKHDLYEQAKAEGIEGRSAMSKDELAKALQRR